MGQKLPRVSAQRVVRALKRAGWYEHYQRGSHLFMRHPERPGVQITIPVHRGYDLSPRLLSRILKDAKLTVEEFIESL